MKRSVALIMVIAGIALAGCGTPAQHSAGESATPTRSSVEVTTGVWLEVSIPSAAFPAGSEQTATITLINRSSREVTVGDIWGLRILEVSGKVFSDPQARLIYPSVQISMGAHEGKAKQFGFRVPPPGPYKLQAYLSTPHIPWAGSRPITFRSVGP